MRIGRWIRLLALAIALTTALVVAITPPHFVRDQIEVATARTVAQLLGIFAAVLVLLFLGELVVRWASRRPRTLRISGLVSLLTGLLSGLLALTLWLAFLAVPLALIGIAAAWYALRLETIDRGGHSLVNLTGLLLNLAALAVFVFQIITATIWR
ncbi:MAG TPA: hypothetical protein VLV78_07195 [Thermoanaerobaculia bacterium]|nr:hypothetical protein [Thermoanaerobaculia bacterium]